MSDDLFDDPGLFAVTPPADPPRRTLFERMSDAAKRGDFGPGLNPIPQDPAPLPPRRSRPKPAALHETPPPVHKPAPALHKPAEDDGPVASFACFCGFRDEVKKPAPERLNCPECKAVDGLVRYVPRYPPPPKGGRELTDKEVARLT